MHKLPFWIYANKLRITLFPLYKAVHVCSVIKSNQSHRVINSVSWCNCLSSKKTSTLTITTGYSRKQFCFDSSFKYNVETKLSSDKVKVECNCPLIWLTRKSTWYCCEEHFLAADRYSSLWMLHAFDDVLHLLNITELKIVIHESKIWQAKNTQQYLYTFMHGPGDNAAWMPLSIV